MDASMRDQLIQFEHNLSKLDVAEVSPEVSASFGELVAFCSANETHSSALDQRLDTDDELKVTCDSLCQVQRTLQVLAKLRTYGPI